MKQKAVLIASAAAGLVAAILTRAYLNAREARHRAEIESLRTHTIEAIVFKKDVPGGAALGRDNLGVQTVASAGIEGRALVPADFPRAEGRHVKTMHRRGEILMWADIEGGAHGGRRLSDTLNKSGMRAVSVNASGAAAVSGMIMPNDHVDVLGTFSFPAKGAERAGQNDLVTMTILQNVTVLATGSRTANDDRTRYGAPQNYSTVTLLVTPREAEMLVFAEQIRGRISLSLRGPHDNQCEKELPSVDFKKIREELAELNEKRNKGHMR